MTQASIVRIAHADLRNVMRIYPAVGEAFSRYLLADAAITAEWLVNVGGRDARTALAHLFCEMATGMKKVENNNFSFHFPVSQLQPMRYSVKGAAIWVEARPYGLSNLRSSTLCRTSVHMMRCGLMFAIAP